MADANQENRPGTTNTTIAVIAVIVTGMIMLGIIVWILGMTFDNGGAGNFASLATLILVGLAAFIGIMNILSLSAHWMNIVDTRQPFGLPEGTVRAILTMAFIVLVGVLTSFMLSNTQRPSFSEKPLIVAKGVSQSAAAVIEQKFAVEGVVAVTKDEATVAAKATAAKDAPATVPETYSVSFYPRIDYRQSDEIAKQILTILSTILAAMIGFYFGAKPGESTSTPSGDATDRADPPQDEKTTLLAQYNALKEQPPTLATVAGKLAAADQAKRDPLQPDYDAIKANLDATDTALADPAATIDTVRTNVATAKAEYGKLTELDKKL